MKTAREALDFRITTHLNLLEQVHDEITAIRNSVVENKGPMRPDRLDSVLQILDLLQNGNEGGPS